MFRRGFLSVAQTCPSCGGAGRLNRNPCSDCEGRGRIEREANLRVNVPPGVDNGMRLRLTGEGERGSRGAPPGDLFVVLAVEPHEVLVREGSDLHLELPITVFQAMLGDRRTVKTILDEEQTVEIPAGSQPGDVVRVRGAGMPELDSSRRGELVVHLRVVVPRKLNAEQRDLVGKAAELGGEADLGSGGGFFERLERWLGSEG
jgi:molecular chaperone DnaJ